MRLLPLLAALALSGCSLLDGDAAEVRAFFGVPAAPLPSDVDVAMTFDGRVEVLTPTEVSVGALLASAPTGVGTGPRPITCTVSTAGASTTVRTSLDVADDWRYDVHCAVQGDDPTAGCFGCSPATSVSLDARISERLALSDGVRLWLYTSGEPEDGSVLYGPTSG